LAAPSVAKHYLVAGDYDRAMEWLEKAFEVHSSGLAGVAADPIYDLCAPTRATRTCCAG
jgi:hypothetical protein